MGSDDPSLFEIFSLCFLGGDQIPHFIGREQRQLYKKVLTKLKLLESGTGRVNPEGHTFGELLKRTYEPVFFPKGELDNTFSVGKNLKEKIEAIQGRYPVLFFVGLPSPSFKNGQSDGLMYRVRLDLGDVPLETVRLLHDSIYDGGNWPYDCWSIQRGSSSYLGRSSETLCKSLRKGDRFQHVLTDRTDWITQLSGRMSLDGLARTTLRFYTTNSERQAYVDGIDFLRFKLSPIMAYLEQGENFEASTENGTLVTVARNDYFAPNERLLQATFKMNPVAVLRYTTDNGSRYIVMIAANAPRKPTGIWPLDHVSPWLMDSPGGTLDEYAKPGTTFGLTGMLVQRLEGVVLVSLDMHPEASNWG